MKSTAILAAALLVFAARGLAAQADTAAAPIQDNSFLVEEAYNQEAGVVQHISTFERSRGGDWEYSLTQEWPLGGIRNQLSYTLPLAHASGETGIGDVMVHYRYQWIGDADASLAVAPRLSAIVPTGDADRGFGVGGFGLQGAIPISTVLVKNVLVAHTNAGITYVPQAKDAVGNREATTSYFLAQSAVWLVSPRFNVLVEGMWAREQVVAGPNNTEEVESAVISPGIRFAIDFPSGLQIVPGVAVPFGVGPSEGERSLFLYLSFEHPFKRQR